MVTAAFMKFMWGLLIFFGGCAVAATIIEWCAAAVAYSEDKARRRIEQSRAQRIEEDPKELVKIYFGGQA